MNDTLIFNKKDFIKWMNDAITDEQVCIISMNIVNFQETKRTKERKLTFSFVKDAFNPITTLEQASNMKGVCLTVYEKDEVPEDVLKLYNNE